MHTHIFNCFLLSHVFKVRLVGEPIEGGLDLQYKNKTIRIDRGSPREQREHALHTALLRIINAASEPWKMLMNLLQELAIIQRDQPRLAAWLGLPRLGAIHDLAARA